MRNLFLIASLLFSASVYATDIKEYGIVLIPDNKCQEEVKKLDREVNKKFGEKNSEFNLPHVKLFRTALKTTDLEKIYADLTLIKLPALSFSTSGFKDLDDMKVVFELEKNEIIQRLHELVVHISVVYFIQPLQNIKDKYSTLTDDQKALVDRYGTYWVFANYHPYFAIHFEDKANPKLKDIAEYFYKEDAGKKLVCSVDAIAIGETGYSGELRNILKTFKVEHPKPLNNIPLADPTKTSATSGK